MWIYSEIGFFSAVMRGDDPGVIIVRGRVKKDVERFQRLVGDLGYESPEISEWALRDYPYRCLVARQVWADAIGHLAGKVNYPNFKARMAEVEEGREILLSKLWLITRTLADIDDDQ